MKHHILWRAFALLLIFLVQCASATSDIVVEKAVKSFDINADGTFSQVNESLVRIKTVQGVMSVAQIPLPYSGSLQTLEVVEAYTLKPNGVRLNVSRNKIFTQAAPFAVSTPTFNDLKYKVIVFPEPLPGGKIYFKVHVKQKIPLFASHFSHLELIPNQFPIESFLIHVSAPSGYNIKTDSREMIGGKQPNKGKRSHWEWTYTSSVGRSLEPNEIAANDLRPFVAISSFSDWKELAKAYRQQANNKVVVSGEIETLANEITRGLGSTKEQSKAIYHWVARNIRYVGIFLGLGGVVPRDANEILKSKYGDCKDYAVILTALLQAKKIHAEPALINTEPSFTLPSAPVIGAFNHVIVYVPDIGLFLDGTASFNRFGVLPRIDTGKPVLLIDSGILSSTPLVSAADNTVHNEVELLVESDGSIRGRSVITTSGEWEASFRRQVAMVPTGQRSNFITRGLGSAQRGSGTYISSDPNKLETPFSFSASYTIKDAINLQAPGAFLVPNGFSYGAIHLTASVGDLNLPIRKTPFTCGSETLSELITLLLPGDVNVVALPRDVLYEGKSVSFIANYRHYDRKIVVSRKLVHSHEREYCDASIWTEMLQIRDAVARDARAQVLIN